MINLCSDDLKAYNTGCNIPTMQQSINETLKRQIELYEKFNPDYVFDRLEFVYDNGIHKVQILYKHKDIHHVEAHN